jgi:ABC-type phosphate/phosphonate transport system substrate-binding protein
MNALAIKLAVVVLYGTLCGVGQCAEPAVSGEAKPIRIGAVAYAPSAVTIFNGVTRYLNRNGLASDYVLYSNYDALVAALDKGEIEIAWNTPLAHAQYHVKNQCSSQTLVMRDVDVDVRATLIVRADSDIKSPADLAGKQLILGSLQSAEATVLPVHFLKKEGIDLAKVKVISLDAEVDSKGNPCASPHHVLQAMREGRGEAGIITVDLWNHVKNQPGTKDVLKQVWTSPPFSHCVFTASAKFDKQLGERFTKLMTAMDAKAPETAEVLRLEGARKWLPGSPAGFAELVNALGGKDKPAVQ